MREEVKFGMKLADNLARFLAMQENPETEASRVFLRTLTEQPSETRAHIYETFIGLVRLYAAEPVPDTEDAAAVEACRKICDVMGWLPAKVA